MPELITDKGLTDAGLALAYFVMISSGWFSTLVWFVDRKHRRMHHYSFGCLIALSILSFISQPLVIKIYAVLSVVAVIVVEAVIRKRRKKDNQPETAI